MPDIQALQKLSREHDESDVFAEQIAQLAGQGSSAQLAEAVIRVQKFYNDELELHFQHEEQTIFAPIFQQYREHIPLAIRLLKEHGYLRVLIQRMTNSTAHHDLAEFCHVLEQHSEIEEQQLFPLVEKLFSKQQLDAVLEFKPL